VFVAHMTRGGKSHVYIDWWGASLTKKNVQCQ